MIDISNAKNCILSNDYIELPMVQLGTHALTTARAQCKTNTNHVYQIYVPPYCIVEKLNLPTFTLLTSNGLEYPNHKTPFATGHYPCFILIESAIKLSNCLQVKMYTPKTKQYQASNNSGNDYNY